MYAIRSYYVSHEFRTPITIILGNLERLTRLNDKQSASVIKKNAIRLLELVNQLIEVRKMDQGKLDLNVSRIDVVSFLKSMLLSFDTLASEKNISLEFYSSKKELLVWLDRITSYNVCYTKLLRSSIRVCTNTP